MRANFKPPFSKFVKKANRPLQLAIDDAVELICDQPEIGVLKQGDLSGVLVYKFKFNRQEYLIAYSAPASGESVEFLVIDFYQVGTHENFYDQLKRYLKGVR